MTYSEKYFLMREWLGENVFDMTELCVLLDISAEDIVKVFPDKLVYTYGKIFTPDETEDGEGEEGEDDEDEDFIEG
jgi:hypothetical protein